MGNSMREFHLHLTKNEHSQQAFLFSVSRNDDNCTLQIHEICIVTQCNGVETKSTLNLDILSEIMGQNIGGNLVPKSYPDVKNLFYDMLTPTSKTVMNQQINIFENSENQSLEQLLNAMDVAQTMHPTLSIDEIVNNILNERKN